MHAATALLVIVGRLACIDHNAVLTNRWVAIIFAMIATAMQASGVLLSVHRPSLETRTRMESLLLASAYRTRAWHHLLLQ